MNIEIKISKKPVDYKKAEQIGNFFRENKIKIDKVLSSEWCRCKETAKIAFKDFSTNSFLNSFYSPKYAKNRSKQIKALKDYIKMLMQEGLRFQRIKFKPAYQKDLL